MPNCPPLTQLQDRQFTSHAKMGVISWLQKILGNVVMWNRQSQAFCGVVLQFREHSNSKPGSVFCDYILQGDYMALKVDLRPKLCPTIPFLSKCMGDKNLQQHLL